MATERKVTMLSARVPAAIVSRVDFVVRNTDGDTTKSRSAAVLAALEAWLPGQESRLEALGVLAKKTR